MNDSELFLCPGAAFSHLRTSPTCDMMGTTKVSEKPHDRGKKRGKSDDAKESIKENMIMAREIINTEKAPQQSDLMYRQSQTTAFYLFPDSLALM